MYVKPITIDKVMKKIFAILVCVCTCVTSAFAGDYIKVNGITLTVNDEGTVIKTDMSEFREVKFLQAFKVTGEQTSDWADVAKDAEGNYYVVAGDMTLKVVGRTVEVVPAIKEEDRAKFDWNPKDFANLGEPLVKYKWTWAYHQKDASDGPGDLYIVIYGK